MSAVTKSFCQILTRKSPGVLSGRHITYSQCGCLKRLLKNKRQLSSKSNADYTVNPEFINRNPRNLESMGLAYKREGWTYQYPRKDYYNKLVFDVTQRHTNGYIEHSSGTTVVSASTQEWPIKEQLHSCTDVSAARCVGQVLARRCLQAGLTHVYYEQNDTPSEKLKVFVEAMREGDVELTEPERIKPAVTTGTDYDNPRGNRYAEPKRWKDDVQIIS